MQKAGKIASTHEVDTRQEVVILIPWLKDSKRFPGKNGLLWKYTWTWLERELRETLMKGLRVTVRVLVAPGKKIHGVPCLEFDGQGDRVPVDEVLDVLDKPENTVFVLLQLTQPVRKRGLLFNAVSKVAAASSRGRFVESAVVWTRDVWRWEPGAKQIDAREDLEVIYDGALYAWQGNHCTIWDGKEPLPVLNYRGPVVDVDYEFQFCPEYIRGVQRLCDKNPIL